MARRCTIYYDPKLDGYHVQCAFNAAFIEFLKAAVPASDRGFDPPSKTWSFAKKYLDPIQSAAEKFFGKADVSVITEKQVAGSAPQTVAKQSIDSVMAEFMRLLPTDAAVSAYRKAALLLHPDRAGGDMEKMARLNVLWDRLQSEVYKP